MKQLVIMVVVLGLAVGWFAPHGESSSTPALADGNARLALARGSGSSDGNAVLSREADGHFYANVSVDAQDLRMLVDTGASVVVLTGNDAEALGLEWSDDDLFPIGRGASGDVIGKPVRLDHVRLGNLEADNVDAVIVPQGLDVSLLGQSFLRQVGKVEIEGAQMVLGGA